MPNKWIEHVKEFSKKNNIPFGCALSHPDLKKDYQPVIKISAKQKREEREKIIFQQIRNNLLSKIKTMNDDDKPLIRMKYNSLHSTIKDDIKNNYTKYYDKLFNK